MTEQAPGVGAMGQPWELPPLLRQDSDNHLGRLRQRLAQDQETLGALLAEPSFPYVLGISDFIARTAFQYPREVAALLAEGALSRDDFPSTYAQRVQNALPGGLPEPELKRRLRVLRRTLMVFIAWRDLTGREGMDGTFHALTLLAELILNRTVALVRSELSRTLGDAQDGDGNPLPLLIYGMGKLGGEELNFSSDIDLIFFYPHDGTTMWGSRPCSHQQFFSRIVQRVSNLLSDQTADGFCYRIDLRLRPFGDAGPLVSSFEAAGTYYETQGRTWERYALVKSRLLGDYGAYGQELTETLRPFVYRRYLDYGAIESLRKLKHTIEAEVRRRRLDDNFKLGMGGIREIEFITQVFELMRGGRITRLQERNLRKTLRSLTELDLLPAGVTAMLDRHYLFLRHLENVVQELSDQQLQTIPSTERDQAKVALGMRMGPWEEVAAHLGRVRSEVHSEFVKIMRDDGTADQVETIKESAEFWDTSLSAGELQSTLEPLMRRPAEAHGLATQILELRQTLRRMPVGPRGSETLVRLMPRLIKQVAAEDQPTQMFGKLSRLIERIALRTTYLLLLNDNHSVLERVINLVRENEFAAALIARHPILMDELIAPHYYQAPPSTPEFLASIRETLLRIPPDDLEAEMEELRLFKQVQVLRIAMSDRAGSLPLMKISDSLSFLAEALVRELLLLSWQETESRYGHPPGCSAEDPGMAVIAYGKLGGLELGYRSDLDMVIIRENGEGMTEGARSVPCSMFYQRLVQRMLHLCTTPMSSGVLYDLDMRLRPDGDSGMLITDVEGFEGYQRTRAWTWEHQALVRARPIAGSPRVMEAFSAIRERVLRMGRDPAKLRSDVLDMRAKMRQRLDRSNESRFDLKQGQGGMVDVEFIAQYLMLREAPRHPDLVLWSDNVRIFDECARLRILPEDQAVTLKDAYLALRGVYHRVSLAGQPRVVHYSDRPGACATVERIWGEILGDLPQGG
ncbi:MAG: bifunctional [glutamate--ammonia ligase]-adenylyl-L-tyrosine phosphorylase/[glutamate--ammonia-ligase] adenylyltransferase [Succinivibrionaceae bacterium]|nr:bifunctional [glutamate--ammonia ligase]-adenylyl-L-tyrosine phosphorylase/[glutamate--ammonia-ligase] adenylyltransferase [Succinivibrionaceae bacterium]